MNSTTHSSRAAFVIGAGGGIGQGAAQLLAQRGVSVACVDRDGAAATATAAAIAENGDTACSYTADVTDMASIADAFAAFCESVGQVHSVINSAGVQGQLGLPSHQVSIDDFDRVCNVNLRGALVVAQVVIPHMLERGYGRIAHVASIAGKEGNPNMIAYSTSKAGLIGMVKAQGKEYGEHGITINALAPAVIHTPFLDTQPQATLDYMIAKIPMKRVGTILEAAQILAWMVSDECSFTTGFTFDLSGGRATY